MQKHTPDERELIIHAAAGNQKAFETLLKQQAANMRGAVDKVNKGTLDSHTVQEVISTAQFRVWRALGTFKFESSFSTWVHRICINCTLTALRDLRKTSREFPLFDAHLQPTGYEFTSCNFMPGVIAQENPSPWLNERACADTAPDALEQLSNRQQLDTINSLLSTLDERSRTIFYRNRVDDVPLVQLAKEHGISRVRAREIVREVETFLRERVAAED